MDRFKLIPEPKNFQDLTAKENVTRLNAELKRITQAINEDRTVSAVPTPTGLAGTFSHTAVALLAWDDAPDDSRADLDGARVWRAAVADDPALAFGNNNAKLPIVRCVRSTNYADHDVTSGAAYIYWVQWVNLEGESSAAAGGLSGTIT